MDDPYKILGVGTSASFEEIKSAYKQQALEKHPDKNIGQNTTLEFQKLKEAYDVLIDPALRASYDQLQTQQYTAPPVDQRIAVENQELTEWCISLKAAFLAIEKAWELRQDICWGCHQFRTPQSQSHVGTAERLKVEIKAIYEETMQKNPNWSSLDWALCCQQDVHLHALQKEYFQMRDEGQMEMLQSMILGLSKLPQEKATHEKNRARFRQTTATRAVRILDARRYDLDHLKGSNYKAKCEAWKLLADGEELAKTYNNDLQYFAKCAEFDKWVMGKQSNTLDLLRE